jgi:hypothetical protein
VRTFAAVMPVANVGALLREADQPKRVQSLALAAAPPEAVPDQRPRPSAIAATPSNARRFLVTKAETPDTAESLLG